MDKKYTIFSGCSYTWGQGLWSYLETDEHVPSYEEWIFEDLPLPSGSIELKNKLNYPYFVSNELNTHPLFKERNGGHDYESLQFILDCEDKVGIENIDSIVLQTTQQYRSAFYFIHKGVEYHLRPTPGFTDYNHVCELSYYNPEKLEYDYTREDIDINVFYDWLIENQLDIDEFRKIHRNQLFSDFEKVLKKYIDFGIPVYILSWTGEYLDSIKNSELLKDRFITFEYNGKKYDCIEYMQNANKELFLRDDPTVLHSPGNDEHPSKRCHKIIANAVLKKMKNE